MGREPVDAFCKSARFAPENEFRIALMGGEDVGTDLHLDIGDLSTATPTALSKPLSERVYRVEGPIPPCPLGCIPA